MLASSAKPFADNGQLFDLYTDLFSQPAAAEPVALSVGAGRLMPATPAPPPRSPVNLMDTGLHLGQLCDLVLKQLYLHGTMWGNVIARHIRLPFSIVDEAVRALKEQRCIEVAAGQSIGRVSYRYSLTELGRLRARETFDHCRYVGPAPVPLEQYAAQCRKQTVIGIPCHRDALQEAFGDFVFRPGLLDEIGPAICTGRSLFIYGPPGNGKSMVAKGLGRFLNAYGGEIYVPYAIQAESSVIVVYDPSIHQTTDTAELVTRGIETPQAIADEVSTHVHQDGPSDLRWRRIRRPVVITGGELTLPMLELQYHEQSHFSNAPLHIKANGGVFLIDDFGRQVVSPKDLLNRWIVPLEERVDYLTAETGRKFSLPFEQLIVFSTNLDPADLVDDAFLRRIRHKIRIDAPDRAVYTEIFRRACEVRGIGFSEPIVEYLFDRHYSGHRVPRSSDPRDLLEIVTSLCRFHDQPVELSEPLVETAARQFFASL